jgi:hypothetical protein
MEKKRIRGRFHPTLRDGFGLVEVRIALLLLLLMVPVAAIPAPRGAAVTLVAAPSSGAGGCQKLQLSGEVKAGESWSASIGQGWTFRVLPIAPSGRGYTGWDLVVDPPADGGYPDALLLGTPPYGSLNEREIGTTFGLRAQDAIAWEPRRFHFLNTAKDVRSARELYRQVMAKPSSASAASELLKLISSGTGGSLSSGQFKIVDARLATGTADPQVFARQWTAHLHQVPHSIVQQDAHVAEASPRGELLWIRFEATLWLPLGWQSSNTTPSACVP